MGRLRAKLSKSDVDRQIQSSVATAQRAVEQALNVCRQARDRRGVEGNRARRVARDLARAKSALGNIGRVTPMYDMSDPDLMTEDDRTKQWRAERAAEMAAEMAEGDGELGFGFEDDAGDAGEDGD